MTEDTPPNFRTAKCCQSCICFDEPTWTFENSFCFLYDRIVKPTEICDSYVEEKKVELTEAEK